jgi:hypothetical protein
MRLDRRQLLAAAAAAGLGATGIYELVDRLAGERPRRAPTAATGDEQHLLHDVRVIRDNGVEIVEPPLHHEVVTARVAGDPHRGRRALEAALRELERSYPRSPAGIGITLAWGLPWFRQLPPHAQRRLPVDRRARKPALLDARRFPSDPDDTILEQNDVAVLLRSDSLAHIRDAHRTLFDDLAIFHVTSIRRGFVGGGFAGGRGLPKQMALAAGLDGAGLIPDGAQLFLGFTSTQRDTQGLGRIANLETLGLTDAAGGYFHGGTHMHLSHIDEDIASWYRNFDFTDRTQTAFDPRKTLPAETQTVAQPPTEAATEADVTNGFHATGRIGHSSSIQPTSRLREDTVAPDGTIHPRGSTIPLRADFNTLDNPFTWTAHPRRDRWHPQPSAGLHFLVFNPSSDDFHRNRLAMDGILPDGTKLPLQPRSRGQGFNDVLRTTHRQNFLVPPRPHRAFPLLEL